jgi:hypothetical protein
LFGIENSLKVYIGRTKALNDPAFVGKLAAAEADLKAKTQGSSAAGNPWHQVDAAVEGYRDLYVPLRFATPGSDLFDYAQTLVRAAEERSKPNSERLPGYTDSSLPLLAKQLLDPRPVYPWLDELTMEWSLSKAREYLGADDPQTKLLLGKEAPEALAHRLVSGSKLADPAVRKALWEGGAAAIAASTDPMIVYARRIDPNARRLEKLYDAQYDAPVTAAQAKLSDARAFDLGSPRAGRQRNHIRRRKPRLDLAPVDPVAARVRARSPPADHPRHLLRTSRPADQCDGEQPGEGPRGRRHIVRDRKFAEGLYRPHQGAQRSGLRRQARRRRSGPQGQDRRVRCGRQSMAAD